MKKPSISDVAEKAGVSPATVDRVLNNRWGASPRSREKVALAVRELRFGELPKDLLVRSLPRLRFLFILPLRASSFTDLIVRGIREAPAAVQDCRIANDIVHVDTHDGPAIVRALQQVDVSRYDGVGLFVTEANGVSAEVNRLVAAGLKVVCLVSDLPATARHHFVGIDNLAAGRVAANLMGRFIGSRRGLVSILVGSLGSRDQRERMLGFEEVLRKKYPNLALLPAQEGRSDPRTNAIITSKLIQKKDLLGIYAVGAGNRGIYEALGDEKRIVFVSHDLTPINRSGLLSGAADAIIAQDPGHITRSAVRILRAHCLSKSIVKAQEQIRIDIILPDSVAA